LFVQRLLYLDGDLGGFVVRYIRNLALNLVLNATTPSGSGGGDEGIYTRPDSKALGQRF